MLKEGKYRRENVVSGYSIDKLFHYCSKGCFKELKKSKNPRVHRMSSEKLQNLDLFNIWARLSDIKGKFSEVWDNFCETLSKSVFLFLFGFIKHICV